MIVISQVRFYVLFGEETGIPIFFLLHRNPTPSFCCLIFMLQRSQVRTREYKSILEFGDLDRLPETMLKILFYDPGIRERDLQQTWLTLIEHWVRILVVFKLLQV